MTRAHMWNRLSPTTVHDLAVIGGGATGLGVALDAALRGFSVVLFESHDFGGGTSSRSTKLLHGGVRYLAQGNLGLVREALAERTTLMHLAPHLAQPLSFVMPSYRWWQRPVYGLGLKLYDGLAGQAGLGPTQWLSRSQTQALLPGVQSQGLLGGVSYWDGQFEDARMALALARSIEQVGGCILNHAQVVSWDRQHEGLIDPFVLQVQDRWQPRRAPVQVRARAVVNATGVWVDELRQRHPGAQTPLTRLVSPSQGVHIVVDRSFLGSDHALLVPNTTDGRVLFAVPWMGALLLGTTDTPRPDVVREPQPLAHEIEFILREASAHLARPVVRADIRSMWVGLRPLVSGSSGSHATARLSREHLITSDDHGMVTVTGGTWTTYRSMAEAVLSHCVEQGVLPDRPGGQTRTHRLYGAPEAGQASVPISGAPGPHLYGSAWPEVCACPGQTHELGMGLSAAMVRHAVRHEYACSVEDVLARRWRALFLDARQAMAMAPAVADLMHQEHGGDARLDEFMRLAAQYGPDPVASV